MPGSPTQVGTSLGILGGKGVVLPFQTSLHETISSLTRWIHVPGEPLLSPQRGAAATTRLLADPTTVYFVKDPVVCQGASICRTTRERYEEWVRATEHKVVLGSEAIAFLCTDMGITRAEFDVAAATQLSSSGALMDIAKLMLFFNGLSVPLDPTKARAESRGAGHKRLRLRGDDQLLSDPAAAKAYRQLMKSKAGLGVNNSAPDSDRGLTAAEVSAIVANNPKRRFLTDVFTQGLHEYRDAGGSDIATEFTLLEASLWDQVLWGNPTAVRNELWIGLGKPEQRLGLVYKYDGTLYYDVRGEPLPGFGGTGFRDPGFKGTAKDPGFINLATIHDETLQGFLKLLHDSFKTPTLIIANGADAYWKNLEDINALIRTGLDEAIKDELENALKILIGFLLYRAIAMALTRQPHPWLKAIGAGMEAGAVVAGYALDIEFLGSTEERLVKAGFHLAKVVPKDDKGEMDDISKLEMSVAAEHIRPMVAQIATMIIFKAGERVARGPKPHAKAEFESVTKKTRRSVLECTFCEIRPPRDGPVRPYINANRAATPEEIRLGTFLDGLAQRDALPGAQRVVGAPESSVPGVRSGDYRFQRPDGRLVGADSIQVKPTTTAPNIFDRITEKATQAPVIIVELPPGSIFSDAEALEMAQAAANHVEGGRIQRVLFTRGDQVIADAVRDGTTP